MFSKIGYYSFTILFDAPSVIRREELFNLVLKTFVSVSDFQPERFLNISEYSVEQGARQYHYRLRHNSSEMALSFGGINNHILVECAGKTCDTFDSADLLYPLISATCERTTRIDFAVDIETTEDPRTFSAFRNSKAFKSSGEQRTPSGRTNYVGGRKGERMARVYRYEPPHPRSHLLRVEAEYKGHAAKAAAGHLLEVGVRQACLDAHSPFQWTSPTWSPENGSGIKIPYKAYRPENAATVRWLYGDVVTALSKALKKGLIDWDEWLKYVRKEAFGEE